MSNNLSLIFDQYVKDLKLTTNEDYVYVMKDDLFGDIIFSVSSTAINMVKCYNIPDKYFGKMISVDVIKDKSIGYEFDIGIINSNEFIVLYNCTEKFKKAMRILNQFKKDIISSAYQEPLPTLLGDESDFYNNVLLKKSAEGAGKFIFNNNIMYMAPCMLPVGKSSVQLTATKYYSDNSDYYTVVFNSNKKNDNEVLTLMKFLNI